MTKVSFAGLMAFMAIDGLAILYHFPFTLIVQFVFAVLVILWPDLFESKGEDNQDAED